MKTTEISNTIFTTTGILFNQISKNKSGNFIARRGFFYTNGACSENYADAVKKAFPSANIIDHGTIYKPFKGGASVSNQSHFYVEFTF